MQIETPEGKSANNMTVIIASNIRKESARIDPDGNIINARTKQIIEPAVSDFESVPVIPVAPTDPVAPVVPVTPMVTQEMSILEQIEQAKQRVIELEALKQAKIAEKKAELELLQQS